MRPGTAREIVTGSVFIPTVDYDALKRQGKDPWKFATTAKEAVHGVPGCPDAVHVTTADKRTECWADVTPVVFR